MQVPDPDTHALQVIRQILRHPLGQRGDQYTFLPVGALVDLRQQILHLPLDGLDRDQRIQQTGGTDHLFHDPAGAFLFQGARRSTDVDGLPDVLVELGKAQWPVVIGTGQPEAIVDQGLFPGVIPCLHGTHLGQGHMAFVHDQQKILGEVIQQGIGHAARGTPGKYP